MLSPIHATVAVVAPHARVYELPVRSKNSLKLVAAAGTSPAHDTVEAVGQVMVVVAEEVCCTVKTGVWTASQTLFVTVAR